MIAVKGIMTGGHVEGVLTVALAGMCQDKATLKIVSL